MRALILVAFGLAASASIREKHDATMRVPAPKADVR
jgi:hypothetical protein